MFRGSGGTRRDVDGGLKERGTCFWGGGGKLEDEDFFGYFFLVNEISKSHRL